MWAPTAFCRNAVQELLRSPLAMAGLNFCSHGEKIEMKKSQSSGKVRNNLVNLRVQKCRISFWLYSLCLGGMHTAQDSDFVCLWVSVHTELVSSFGSLARKCKDMDKTPGEISGTSSDPGLGIGVLPESRKVTSLLPARKESKESRTKCFHLPCPVMKWELLSKFLSGFFS